MMHAIVYAEDGNVVGRYPTRDEAERKLAEFCAAHPDIEDEVGLRTYSEGRPAGAFEPADQVLGESLAQRHLV